MDKKHSPIGKKFLIALPTLGLVVLFGSAFFVPLGQAALVNLNGVTMAKANGGSHSLVLKSDGMVLAWGVNDTGQLGDGTVTPRLTPVQVSGLGSGSGVVAISAGNSYSLALKSDGTVLAWGNNQNGQLGNGTAQNSFTPVQVSGLGSGSGVVAISAGFNCALALKSDGTVWAWGVNGQGQLGDGTTTNRPTPVQVHGAGNVGFLTGVSAISSGFRLSAALKFDGTVWTWGLNASGQLGDGTFTQRNAPVQVHGVGNDGFLTDVAAISAGSGVVLALKADGTVLAWGNNTNGALGVGTTISSSTTPIQVHGVGNDGFLTDVTAIFMDGTAGGGHSLAVKYDGTVLAWGPNGNGQLGDGTTTQRNAPVEVTGLGSGSGVTAVAAGLGFSLALKSDGTVLAWGTNSGGQLGNDTFFGQTVPVQVSGLSSGSDVIKIASGTSFSLALKSDGTVLAWGINNTGQLGNETTQNSSTPVQVSGLGSGSGVTAISAGGNFSLALKFDGTVWAWGTGGAGALGQNTNANSLIPVQVHGMGNVGILSDIAAVSAGENHAMALKSDGTVLAWGGNVNGQIGDNSVTQRNTPVQVSGLGSGSAVVAVSAGTVFSLALKSDGTVLAWGPNGNGQLGDGTLTQQNAPVEVTSLGSGSGVTAIAAAVGSSFALKSDGTLLAWGNNSSGQLGDGTTMNRFTPIQITGLNINSEVASILGPVGVAGNHTLALTSDGTVWAWGGNSSGQLGTGSLEQSLAPVQVTALGNNLIVTAISAGASDSMALMSDGTVLAWGANESGQLGDGTVYTENLTPHNVLFDDTNPPVTTFTLGDSDEDGLIDSLTVASTDSGGVQEIRYSVNGLPGTLSGGIGEILLPNAAFNPSIITFFAIDNGGNAEDVQTLTLNVDNCPNIAGSADFQGCPIAKQYNVSLHTMNIGGGPSTTNPLPGVEVRVFDRNNPDFQAVAGSKNPEGSLYGIIFEAAAGMVSACVTGDNGNCLAGEAMIGEDLVIMKFFDQGTNKTVYVGGPSSQDDKNFQVIKVMKNGVFQEYRGGSKIVVSGSE